MPKKSIPMETTEEQIAENSANAILDTADENTDVSLMESTAGEAGDSGDEPAKSQTDRKSSCRERV